MADGVKKKYGFKDNKVYLGQRRIKLKQGGGGFNISTYKKQGDQSPPSDPGSPGSSSGGGSKIGGWRGFSPWGNQYDSYGLGYGLLTLGVGIGAWFLFSTFWAVVITVLTFFWRFSAVRRKYSGFWSTIFVIITILVLLLIGYVLYSFATGTGLGQEWWSLSKTWKASAQAEISDSPFTYFRDCYILSTEGCEIAEIKGDDGGIFITRLETDLDEYDEKTVPVHIEGFLSGKTWTGGARGSGPEINSIDTKVSADWVDPTLKVKYPNGWTCEPLVMRGANDEFMCYHEPIDIDEFKGTGVRVCGILPTRTKEGLSAALSCQARAIEQYEYSTSGFRLLRFAQDTTQYGLETIGKTEVMWSAGAPVVLTIGENIDWNKPLKVYYDYPRRVELKMSNNVPMSFSEIYKGLSPKDMSAILHRLTLEIPDKPGIEVYCNDGKTIHSEGRIICEYDLEDKKITGSETAEKLVDLHFDESYQPAPFEDFTLVGKVEYTAVISRAGTVKLRYRNEKQTEEPTTHTYT